MDLSALHAFLIIGQEQHLTRAAARLHIAQPNLTRLMRKLEEELGFALFDRSNKRRFALTPAGQVFLEEVTRLLPHYDQAVRNAHRIARGERERLVIGYIPAAMLSNLLPLVIGEFERTTSAELVLQDLSSHSSQSNQRRLRDHRLDALLVNEPCDEPDIAQERVASASLVIALPSTHPLATLEVLPLAALAQESWIHPLRPLSPFLIDGLMDGCQQAGFTPRVVRCVPHIQTILSLVAAGIGIAPVTTWTAQAIQQQGVIYRPLLDMSTRMELYVQWCADHPSSLLQTFLLRVREVSSRQTDASREEIESSQV